MEIIHQHERHCHASVAAGALSQQPKHSLTIGAEARMDASIHRFASRRGMEGRRDRCVVCHRLKPLKR